MGARSDRPAHREGNAIACVMVYVQGFPPPGFSCVSLLCAVGFTEIGGTPFADSAEYSGNSGWKLAGRPRALLQREGRVRQMPPSGRIRRESRAGPFESRAEGLRFGAA